MLETFGKSSGKMLGKFEKSPARILEKFENHPGCLENHPGKRSENFPENAPEIRKQILAKLTRMMSKRQLCN